MVTSEKLWFSLISELIELKPLKRRYPKNNAKKPITGSTQKIKDEERIVSNIPTIIGSTTFKLLLNNSLYPFPLETFSIPIISISKFESLKTVFPKIVGYKISESETKLAAAWLIESAGLKGYKAGNVGVHKNQALVIVNYGNASGKEIMNLAKKIQITVLEKFGVHIQPEVNIL